MPRAPSPQMSTIPVARQKLIERIVGAARSRKRRDDLPSSDTFLREYFRGVAEEDLRAYSSAELAAAALAHLRAARVRKRNQPIVRVFNPEEARDGWNSQHTVGQVTNADMPFLVDSLGNALSDQELTVHLTYHPVR